MSEKAPEARRQQAQAVRAPFLFLLQ